MDVIIWEQNPHDKHLRLEGFNGKIEIYSLTLVRHPYIFKDVNEGIRHEGIRAFSALFHNNIMPAQDFHFAYCAETADLYSKKEQAYKKNYPNNPRTHQSFFVTENQEELIDVAKLWCENQFREFVAKLNL